MQPGTKNCVLAVACIAFATGITPLARAQGTPGAQPRGVRTDKVSRELQRQVEMQMIEQALTESGSQHVKRYPPLVLDQIREDFLRIQVVDRKLMEATSLPDGLDLKLVGASVGEIRKRSRRLKENLALPPPPEAVVAPSTKGIEATRERLRSSLTDLSHLIDEFVSNSMFEHSKLVDPELSGKARRDIESIIELSQRIKQASEKLKSLEKSRMSDKP